ncbi:sensor histidine kinase [Microbacterium sp. NPDC057659]|uniref:sensor histidine kinase n=1 Tax=Microbacterium sp. NPDC057659 TaxID=3346198 RepID=UPI003672FC1C
MLLPLLLFGLLTVCAVLVPVGDAIATSRTQQLTIQRGSSADMIVRQARNAVAQGDTASLDAYLRRFHDTYREAVVVLGGGGEDELLAEVGDLPMDAHASAVALAAARNVPQWSVPTIRPWSADTAIVAEPFVVDGSAASGVVVLAMDLTAAKADILRWWLAIAAIGAVLLAALLAASQYWTRWVLRPVLALDVAANALADRADPGPAVLTGPPELRRLSATFARMADAVSDSLEQQRGFVADASHQLRNPLAAIRLRIDSLPRAADAAELQAVEDDLDRLERIVDRMLVLANAEHRATARTSRDDHQPDPLDPPECVVSAAELAESHRAALDGTGIRLVAAEGGSVTVPCRRRDLDETVEILVDNARKYAGRDATVRIELARRDGQVVLEVADSGPGLSDDDLARVGTRFWRSPEHSAEPGTGLGIAILLEIARECGANAAFDRAPEGGLRARLTWGSS